MTYLFDAAAYGARGRASTSTRCAVEVPLPSSPEPAPWLYLEPDDADDYLDQLDSFIEEQVQAGCLLWARQEVVDGIRFFHLAPYGFERATRAAHERLLEDVGPAGRYDPRIEGPPAVPPGGARRWMWWRARDAAEVRRRVAATP